MTRGVLRFAGLAFLVAALGACDGVPAVEGSGTGSLPEASDPAAGAAAAPVAAKPDRDRIAALEAEVAELKRLLAKVTADGAGNLTVSANLRVDGAVGINAAPVAGTGLQVAGASVGAKISGRTAVVARGVGDGSVGVDSDGDANGVLATGTVIGVASAGRSYSFYGFEGVLRNDDGIRRAPSPRASGLTITDAEQRRLVAPPPDEPAPANAAE